MAAKWRWIALALFTCLFLGTAPAMAQEGWRSWKEGRVTAGSRTEGRQVKLEVDGIPYSFMPQAQLYKMKRQRNGGFSLDPIQSHQIYTSQDVRMLVQGFRIYELHVLQ